ncbi:MAG: hypothetical protein AAF735_04205 [Myxococcota bacterium]
MNYSYPVFSLKFDIREGPHRIPKLVELGLGLHPGQQLLSDRSQKGDPALINKLSEFFGVSRNAALSTSKNFGPDRGVDDNLHRLRRERPRCFL